jgi:peptide subunit release factor 1 (eRF1)
MSDIDLQSQDKENVPELEDLESDSVQQKYERLDNQLVHKYLKKIMDIHNNFREKVVKTDKCESV